MGAQYCTRCDGLQRTTANAEPCTRCGGTGYEPEHSGKVIAPRELPPVAAKKVCSHQGENGRPGYDYWICNDCLSVKTDGGWGIASNRWFPDLATAMFFRKHGRMPEVG